MHPRSASRQPFPASAPQPARHPAPKPTTPTLVILDTCAATVLLLASILLLALAAAAVAATGSPIFLPLPLLCLPAAKQQLAVPAAGRCSSTLSPCRTITGMHGSGTSLPACSSACCSIGRQRQPPACKLESTNGRRRRRRQRQPPALTAPGWPPHPPRPRRRCPPPLPPTRPLFPTPGRPAHRGGGRGKRHAQPRQTLGG